MNGDGHLDVIVGSEERMFVAYGDGLGLATAVPYQAHRPGSADAGPADYLPMPLAAGDVTGDGRVDFVFREGLLLSAPSSVPGRDEYTPAFGSLPRWTAAVIADLNANGYPDILAGSSERPGINFYNGTGTSDLTLFELATSRPVQRISVGDFDGDLVEDVAFTQAGGSEPTEEQVMISFGVPFGPPLPAVAVARLTNVEQMGTYREAKLSHLLIASSESTDGAERGVLTLLTGSGDRIPVALYELTTFASDNSVIGSIAVRVLGGAFTSPAPGDVLALGVEPGIGRRGPSILAAARARQLDGRRRCCSRVDCRRTLSPSTPTAWGSAWPPPAPTWTATGATRRSSRCRPGMPSTARSWCSRWTRIA